MDSSSPRRQSGLRAFKSKIALWKGKNKVSSEEHDAGSHATNPAAPGDEIPDRIPKDRGGTSAGHSLVVAEDSSGSIKQIENILKSMHTLVLAIDYHSYACSDMAHQMRLLSDMVGEPNDGSSNSHSRSKRDSFVGSPNDETHRVHARCAAHSATFWEKQSAIQESVLSSITDLYQRINEDAKELFEYQAREDDKVKKFLSDLDSHMSTLGNEAETARNDGNVDGNIHSGLLSGQWRESAKCPFPLAQLPGYSFRMRAPAAYPRMGAFDSSQMNDSDAGANDTVAEQIRRIRSEVIYSWSRKREANFSALKDDLVRSFAVGTTLAGSRAFLKAQKTFGAFQEMVYFLPDALRRGLDAASSETDDSFRGSSSPVCPVGDADTLQEKAAKVMTEKITYARQRAAPTRDYHTRFHASQKSTSNLELPPDHLEECHRMTGDPELDSSLPKSKQAHLASDAPRSFTYPVQHHGDTDSRREQRGWCHLTHNSEFRMHDTRQDIDGSATQQHTLRRPANGQNDILAFRAAISVNEDRIFSKLLTSVGALKTAHGPLKELEVKRIGCELANSVRESSFRASETFRSKLMGTDPTSYHSIDLKSGLLKQLSTPTDRRPPSSLAVEASSMDPPKSIVIHLGPEQVDEATVRRTLKEGETNMQKGITGNIFGINTTQNCLAPAFKRRQVQVLVESACRQIRFDDASDSACAKPHRRCTSMVSLGGGSILKRTGKFVRQNNGRFHITEPRIDNSKWEPGDNYLPLRTEFEIALEELYSTQATHPPPENHERPTEQLKDQILASIYSFQDRETRSRAKAQHPAKNKESNIKGIEVLRRRNEWFRQEGIDSNHQSHN